MRAIIHAWRANYRWQLRPDIKEWLYLFDLLVLAGFHLFQKMKSVEGLLVVKWHLAIGPPCLSNSCSATHWWCVCNR